MRARIQPLLVGLLGAILGTVLVLVGWHLWTDHAALHDLATYVNAMAPKINKIP